MDPWTMMAAVTALKSVTDAQKEKRDIKLASATQRYAPWTGLSANKVQYADPIGNAISGAGTAMAMEQGNKQAAADDEVRGIMKDYYKAKTASMLGGQGKPQSAFAPTPMAFNDAEDSGAGIPYGRRNPWGF